MFSFNRLIRVLLILALVLLCGAASAENTLEVPASTRVIQAEAFANVKTARAVTLPEGIQEIHSRAFANSSITSINLPSTLTFIADDTFENCLLENLYADEGTYAYNWALSKGMFFLTPNPVSDFEYTIYNGECTIKKYIGSGNKVVIPDTIEDYPVRRIGSWAFNTYSNEISVESIIIPNSVRIIESNGFRQCKDLKSIVIPEGVKQINSYAFVYCENLTEVYISGSVTYIGIDPFGSCFSLNSIIVSANSADYCDIDGVLMDKDCTRVINYPIAKDVDGSYVVPKSVNRIDDYAFRGCGLKRIICHDGISVIEDNAFEDSEKLEEIVMPKSLVKLGEMCFNQCEKLKSIDIPKGITVIADWTFQDCDSLTSVTIPDGVLSIESRAFNGCRDLTSATLPRSLKSIADDAFNYSALTTVFAEEGSYACEWALNKGYNVSYVNAVAHPVTGITLNIGAVALTVGQTIRLEATVEPDNADNTIVIWQSDNTSVATVSEGLVTALMPGNAIIRAVSTDRSDISAICMVSVSNPVTDEAWEDFGRNLSNMIMTYGETVEVTEEGGKYETARLIIQAVDALPDISAYNPTNIAVDPEGNYIIQFLSDVDAKDCASYLSLQPGMGYVEPDQYMYLDTSVEGDTQVQSASLGWSVSRVHADQYAANLASRGKTQEIIVAVVDTGIHPSNRIFRNRLVGGYDVVNGNNTPVDVGSHGTHVAGIVVDCTPGLNVKIMPIGVFFKSTKRDPWATCASISLGVRYAVEHAAKVINMSLGGPLDNSDEYLHEAIKYAHQKGVTVVVSAGNNRHREDYPNLTGDTSLFCPAHIASCITVAATNEDNKYGDFSNYGDAVDIAAPGVNINSAVGENEYEAWPGTSMAAPHVSAAAAMLLLDYPNLTYTEVESKLRKAATDLGPVGWDRDYGAGLLNLEPFMQSPLSDFEINKGVITGYVGSGGKVYIPTKDREGNVIREINENAFANCNTITSISIPDNITSIGDDAFSSCKILTFVRFGSGVTMIPTNAFKNCSALRNIVLPKHLTGIGHSAFCNCVSLEKIHFPDTLEYVHDYSFANCKTLKSIEFPNGFIWAGDNAFESCSGLVTVSFPSTVETIMGSTFLNCTSLLEVNLPEELVLIWERAFMNCSSLKSIKIPDSVECISDDVFSGCSNLSVVNYPENIKTKYNQKSNNSPFANCEKLTRIVIPKNVTSLPANIFYNATSLTSVYIGDKVSSIGENAFYNHNSSMTIYGKTGSYAQEYAEANNIPFHEANALYWRD